MPIGYLISVVIVTWGTAFALVMPLPHRSNPANRSAWFSVLLNEAPFIGLYWLIADTALAFSQGNVRTPAGWAVFALALLTALGLALIVWRSLQTRPAIDRALHTACNADGSAMQDIDARLWPRAHLPWARILFAPWFIREQRVERLSNISYGSEGEQNLLDLYRPRGGAAGKPTLIYFHGGAFVGGSKSREARPLLYHLARRGWVCISANYRIGPTAHFPDYQIDAKRAIAWVRTHGREYAADPALLFVAGSSAGAHIAALAALTPNDPAFQPGFEEADTSVAAAICLYGYYGALDDARLPSEVASYARADAPPFFVAHGTRDSVVLIDDARAFVRQLRGAAPRLVVYAELPGAQHTFDLLHSIRFDTVIAGIDAFAAWVQTHAA